MNTVGAAERREGTKSARHKVVSRKIGALDRTAVVDDVARDVASPIGEALPRVIEERHFRDGGSSLGLLCVERPVSLWS